MMEKEQIAAGGGGWRELALALVLVVFAMSPVGAQEEEIGLPLGSSPAASIQVEDLEGKAVDLASYVGKKPVVIEFWATWCPLCEALFPKLTAAQKKHGDKVDFLIVAVAVNQTTRSIKRHVERHPLGFPVFWDAKGAAVRAFEAPSTSYIVALDAMGKVAYTGLGDKQDIEKAVQKVLQVSGKR